MIRLEQFATGATKALKDAIKAAKADGATGIVFDLRANPGGYVERGGRRREPVRGRRHRLPGLQPRRDVEGRARSQPGRARHRHADRRARRRHTASSAEIVTGAIQDAKRGQVVGEKTFGTGTVLGRFDLKDGSSLRIGVERWLTRNGRPIWHEGLEPDVKVVLPEDVQPLLPTELEDMSRGGLREVDRTQVQEGRGAAHLGHAEAPGTGNQTAAGDAGGRGCCWVAGRSAAWPVRDAVTWRLQSEVLPSGDSELPTQPHTQVTCCTAWRYSAITCLRASGSGAGRREGSPLPGRRTSVMDSGPPLGEAGAAVDRLAGRRAERDLGLLPAGRAGGREHLARAARGAVAAATAAASRRRSRRRRRSVRAAAGVTALRLAGGAAGSGSDGAR